MFANRFRLTLCDSGQDKPVPAAWLDQFFMRNFTGYSAFDETLVVGDGQLEAGSAVDPEEMQERFEKWLRQRKMIPPETTLSVECSEH
jgi:hypothetical protein